MALAWFICPMKRRDVDGRPGRYCAMDDFTPQIRVDAGDWAETEILGSAAIVKVRASAATLTTINAGAGFLRVPNHVNLNDTLGDLTTTQKNALLNEALSLGYTQAEINAVLPADWSNVTLRQVLHFLATRRLKPRFDISTNTIILDGPIQPVTSVDLIDSAIQ